ncbi:hypothetical protein EHS25_008853 [Saitozyma podzolica]|uniref:Uncharacterized protein n=1 Tax=Saitozyma podzolica TaxID=1890683 RepID=A0A427YMS7_9TREE|nr:hypothetical protein EHS25_008853 [Saitozyma podzolica]
MAESALSSNETAADRAGGSSPLRQPSVDFAHAVRRSHHARSDASSCEGEEQLPDLRTALTHLHAAATFLANIRPPEYTEVEVAYMRKWFGNELDQFSSSASDFPEEGVLRTRCVGFRRPAFDGVLERSNYGNHHQGDLRSSSPLFRFHIFAQFVGICIFPSRTSVNEFYRVLVQVKERGWTGLARAITVHTPS